MEKKIRDLLDNSNSIAIFFHINPDGDAVGSSLALKFALNQLNKKDVTVFSSDKIPENLEFLNKDNSICYTLTNKKFDLGIVLDCNEPKRVGIMEKVLNNCKNILNIDHHIPSEFFKEYQIINSDASSTCEILYYFFKDLNIKFNKDICLSLYTGLATDSGCFMFSITDGLHFIANELVKNIDNVEDLNYYLFRQKSFGEVALYGQAINKLELFCDNRLVITNLTLSDFEKTGTKLEHTPGIVFSLSGLANVDVVCVMSEEKSGVFKIAFRSKTTDVRKLAILFGGGGHKYASGCKLYGTKNAVKNKIISKVKEFLCTE